MATRLERLVGRELDEFTAAEARRISNATPHQQRYWDKIDLVKPSVQSTKGQPGKRRLYSRKDLIWQSAIVEALHDGWTLQLIRNHRNESLHSLYDFPDTPSVPERVERITKELDLLEKLLALAQAEGGPLFMGWPDRWWEAHTRRCINEHVSTHFLKSEALRREACLEAQCREKLFLTFPEDQDGPLQDIRV